MTFYWLVLTAWLRGLRYCWPNMPFAPEGWESVGTCGMPRGDVKPMYARRGWIPYCFQRSRDHSGRFTSRMFIVKSDY
jgi:hypothetical protein